MNRVIPIILFSIASGVLIRTIARHFVTEPSTPQLIASPDIAVQLRTLTGSAPPAKLWATDFAAFVSTHPGQWVVGHCAQPCLSEPEAARQARIDAAKAVWPIVAARLQQSDADTDWIHDRVTADVISGRLDSDTLAERFQRPYGAVWADSVLLDVSPPRVDPLLNSWQSDFSNWQNHRFQMRQAIVISIAAAWIAYLFLNWVTKGYFTTRLRLSAAAVTIVGAALLV